ncbi:S9 family peptidase [Pleomorphomonas sp. JP5]|uniref:alpha/beta hydrolase family protein n=1 Tax=Pleomorphomonas sp. JP5 TaxID=2942998 RepID=UPI002042FC6B|nr:alpha/beta hydrolase [Pleomorphomonas sp. JP5]MCM5559052.1 alpha/beta hydrolase [Pleomorphomonas sp. JP5]
MQGSGCASSNSSDNLAKARAAFADFAVLTVEKYGVEPSSSPEPTGEACSAEFYRNHSVLQRVADYLDVIATLRDSPWWNGRLVLFRGSEGADVASRLAVPAHADAAVVLSLGGGYTFGEDVRWSFEQQMIREGVPRDQWPDLAAVFSEAKSAPRSGKAWGGSGYRFWADSVDHRAADDLIRFDGPILMIHGSADTSVPVASARATLDRFADAKRCNLTFWEFTGYDHGMTDMDGRNHMTEVLDQAALWVKTRLAERGARSPCMAP